jgi:hypothetical protein
MDYLYSKQFLLLHNTKLLGTNKLLGMYVQYNTKLLGNTKYLALHVYRYLYMYRGWHILGANFEHAWILTCA